MGYRNNATGSSEVLGGTAQTRCGRIRSRYWLWYRLEHVLFGEARTMRNRVRPLRAGAETGTSQAKYHRPPRTAQFGGDATFVQADVSRLPLDRLGAVYALDIGCLHSLPDELRPAYAAGIHRALTDDGYFHLYVFDRNSSDGPGARGNAGRRGCSAFRKQTEDRD